MMGLRWFFWLTRYRIEVRGQSMAPTFCPGSRLWVSRLAYLLKPPARGDVVAIRSPVARDRLELKRVIGLPGEEIAWSDGRFHVNGVALGESYARIPPSPPGDLEQRATRLGRHEYFVAGDNRLYSHDSRRYGPVNRSVIRGKILP